MNYRYLSEFNCALKQIVRRKPAASLHEIQQSHPALRSMSLDHLALRVAQLNHDPAPASLK